MSNELIQLDLTWEEMQEQREANIRKEEAAKKNPKIRKYI